MSAMVFERAVFERADGVPAAKGEWQASAPDAALPEDGAFVAASSAMLEIRRRIGLLAPFDFSVLLVGESGSGKEVAARLLHRLSGRPGRFLRINCAAIPDELLESELFGYEPGAFTGATRPRPGKFEEARHGTILLDEIGEMSPCLQAKLLHVLQDGRFTRLGGRSELQADARILSATNIDVPAALAAGQLREDLYYRLGTFTVELPPLRRRPEDVPQLIRHFLARHGSRALSLPDELLGRCLAYPWPGNVRELENFVRRYIVFGPEAIESLRLPAPPADESPEPTTLRELARRAKSGAERTAILRALEVSSWNRKRAARLLRISYKGLRNKVGEYGLAPGQL